MTIPKISIIVPVYRAELYLKRCVDSIISQTYSDWELLLIDDGSPDRSGEICDLYASKDHRIRVFHKSNGGVSSARNLGIDNAKGEYITFLDSDDWVDHDYLKDFALSTVLDFPKCLVVQGIKQFIPSRSCCVTMFKYGNSILNIKNDIDKVRTLQVLKNGCPVAKIFKRKVIVSNGLRFNEGISLNEDHLFVMNYLLYIDTVILRSGIHYNYLYDFQVPSLTKISHSTDESIRAAYALNNAFSMFLNKYRQNINDWEDYILVFGISQLIRASKQIFKEKNRYLGIKKIIFVYRSLNLPLKVQNDGSFYSTAFLFWIKKNNVKLFFLMMFLHSYMETFFCFLKYYVKCLIGR